MGRWLHFVRENGAEVVGMDVSAAVDVAAQREAAGADFVQADLRCPPFPPESFDLVYSFGVVHHLADPASAVRSLAALVRPGGTLRLYVYRSLADEGRARRALLGFVTGIRSLTTRLPPDVLHAFSWTVSAIATAAFSSLGVRSGDRASATASPAAGRWSSTRTSRSGCWWRSSSIGSGPRWKAATADDEVEAWLRGAGLEVVAILPGLGWRAIARKPPSPAS